MPAEGVQPGIMLVSWERISSGLTNRPPDVSGGRFCAPTTTSEDNGAGPARL